MKRRAHHSRSCFLHSIRYFDKKHKISLTFISVKFSWCSPEGSKCIQIFTPSRDHWSLTSLGNNTAKVGNSCNEQYFFLLADHPLVSISPIVLYFTIKEVTSYTQSNSTRSTCEEVQGLLVLLSAILSYVQSNMGSWKDRTSNIHKSRMRFLIQGKPEGKKFSYKLQMTQQVSWQAEQVLGHLCSGPLCPTLPMPSPSFVPKPGKITYLEIHPAYQGC